MKRYGLFLFVMFFTGLFGALAFAANGPINYSEQEQLPVTPTVCQVFNNTMDMVLTAYAVGVPATEIMDTLDKSILENIKDDDQYLGRTMVSMYIAEAIKVMNGKPAPSMADKLTIAKSLVDEMFISCRQDVGKTRGAYHRN